MTLRARMPIALWTIFWLVVIDVATNLLFAYPADPRETRPGRLQSYFEYGRSVEGKFHAMTGPTDETSAPILTAGWLEQSGPLGEGPTARRPDDRRAITIYGMSHARRLAKAVERTTPDVAIRSVTAPAATPNWTYAAYTREASGISPHPEGRGDSSGTPPPDFEQPDAVVYAILSATVPMINTLSNATAFFDQARPYTQPRFEHTEDGLIAREPPFLSLAGYRSALASPDAWEDYRATLARLDPYYDPLLFCSSVLDHSALIRVLRRGYAIGSRRRLGARVYGRDGFVEDSEEIVLLRSMVVEFARLARAHDVVPVIYVANSLGYSDHLYRALEPVLSAESIVSLESHDFCSPSDPRCYLPDSHFLPEIDDAMARALVQLVDEAAQDHDR